MRQQLLILTISLLWAIYPLTAKAQTISFAGYAKETITVTPEKSTGLDAIYVAYSTRGLSVKYKPKGSGPVTWYSFKNLGGAYAEKVDNVETIDGFSVLSSPEGDTGYIIDDDNSRTYFWLTDYSAHKLRLQGVAINDEKDCSTAYITIQGNGDAIHYFSITGRQLTLSRDITISYHTQEWNEEDLVFNPVEITKTISHLANETPITPAPLVNTNFYVEGDRFLAQWGEVQNVQSGVYSTPSVEVHTRAEQTSREAEDSNEISSGDGLGGSAPAEITFNAYTSDAVLHKEWQFSTNPDFGIIQYRFSQQDLTYTFAEEGTTYVRFIGSNADGSCESESEVYTVSIGASELHCPNAFSPDASEGINDEWKVSYKSLITFKCWIFDRYGTQIFYFDDPRQGWDGKYKGKFVKPGVYYYVIEATGSDGKHYKKGGDINILRYKSIRGAGSVE